MSITVNLWSRKTGELRRFLKKYYGREIFVDEDAYNWIYVYNKPVEAVDIISAVIDNNDKYQISIFIQIDEGNIHPITVENHNDIIKGIFYLFYEESTELLC